MRCSTQIECDNLDRAPAVFLNETRKARNPHRCCECYRTIEPGEIYVLCKGLWDGMWGTYKTCADCQSVRDTLFGCYQFETLWWDVENYVDSVRGDVPEACMVELTPAARAKVCDLIEKEWER